MRGTLVKSLYSLLNSILFVFLSSAAIPIIPGLTIQFPANYYTIIKYVLQCGRVVTVAASHARGSEFDSESRQGFHLPIEVGKISSN